MPISPARTILALALLVLVAPFCRAQSAPVPPPAADAALASQAAAFLALPDVTRQAAQDALVWLGFYNGVVDGDFGQRTRDAILAFQASVKAPADGTLSAAELSALFAAARKARDAVGFQVVADARTGAKVGAPATLLTARAGTKLDFASSDDPDLGALYARLSAATPTRKIAYKAIKPDAFFVVSGQEGASKFYTRFDKNGAANPPIRGFTFAYPAARAGQLDRIAIAAANSFEPFPSPAAAPANATPGSAAAGGGEAPVPEPDATALVIAPGKALTAMNAAACPNPIVGDKPVRFERVDAATGLAIIAGDFGERGEAPRFGPPAPDLVVLGFSGSRVSASAASLAGDEARPVAIAAIERSGGGGPVFDRRGALVGLVAPVADEPKRIAGVALVAPHTFIAANTVRAFLAAGDAAPDGAPPLTAGDIAGREKNALLAVYCRR